MLNNMIIAIIMSVFITYGVEALHEQYKKCNVQNTPIQSSKVKDTK